MTRRFGITPFLLLAAPIALVLVIVLFRASPLAVTLIAVSLLLLMLTFIMPELTLHIVVLSMLLSPEVALMQLGGVRGGHDMLTLRLEDFMLIFLGFSMLARVAIMKELSDFQRSPLNGPILAYFGICATSTMAGFLKGYVSPVGGFFYLLKFFEYYFIYYMVFTTVHDERQAKRLLTTFIVTASCVILYGLWQIPLGERISAPFEGRGTPEPNTLGGYLVLVISVAIGLFAGSRGYFKRAGWGLLIFSAIIALLYTLSRASWVAMVPVVIAFMFLYKRHVPLLTFAAPLLVFLWLVGTPGSLKNRVEQRVSETFTGGAAEGYDVFGAVSVDSSTAGRIQNFASALAELPKDPILGRGVSGWGLADTHWARLIGETGVAGTLAFGWLIFAIIANARRVRKWANDQAPKWGGLADGYLMAVAGILGHSLGTETFIIVRIMEPFWFITALVLVLPSILPAHEPTTAEPATELGPQHPSVAYGPAFPSTFPDRT